MTTIPDFIRQAMDQGGREYKPGDIVPESGIYNVTHDQHHKSNHQVTAIKGKRFPPCRSCGHITYRLAKEAVHLHDHPDYDHSR